MNLKLIVTAALLVFVAVSVVIVAVQENRNASKTHSTDTDLAVAVEDGVDVTYFHGSSRCPTCLRIEAYAEEAVQSRFEDEPAGGTVRWHSVNYDLPENAHYLDDYRLIAPTVVVAHRRDGQEVAWQNLDRVWELVGDQPAFAAYIQEGVDSYLAEGTPE